MSEIKTQENSSEAVSLTELTKTFVQLLRAAPEGASAKSVMNKFKAIYPDVDVITRNMAAVKAADALMKQHSQ